MENEEGILVKNMYNAPLENIGFYTLFDSRITNPQYDWYRVEIILTGRCNFNCPYCRHIGGEDIDYNSLTRFISKNLYSTFAIRFSGGEPTLYKELPELIAYSVLCGIPKIAISTNGYSNIKYYKELIRYGVNDISISLDACCASDAQEMSGGISDAFGRVSSNIKELSRLTYVTVGVVLNEKNQERFKDIVEYAHSLGVSDIRVVPASQNSDRLQDITIRDEILQKHSILRYRYNNMKDGIPIRGLIDDFPQRCGLVLDDMAIMGNKHYPCIIHMREGGNPIGSIDGDIKRDRQNWYCNHNIQEDEICKNNCLDVCLLYNLKYANYNTNTPY